MLIEDYYKGPATEVISEEAKKKVEEGVKPYNPTPYTSGNTILKGQHPEGQQPAPFEYTPTGDGSKAEYKEQWARWREQQPWATNQETSQDQWEETKETDIYANLPGADKVVAPVTEEQVYKESVQQEVQKTVPVAVSESVSSVLAYPAFQKLTPREQNLMFEKARMIGIENVDPAMRTALKEQYGLTDDQLDAAITDGRPTKNSLKFAPEVEDRSGIGIIDDFFGTETGGSIGSALLMGAAGLAAGGPAGLLAMAAFADQNKANAQNRSEEEEARRAYMSERNIKYNDAMAVEQQQRVNEFMTEIDQYDTYLQNIDSANATNLRNYTKDKFNYLAKMQEQKRREKLLDENNMKAEIERRQELSLINSGQSPLQSTVRGMIENNIGRKGAVGKFDTMTPTVLAEASQFEADHKTLQSQLFLQEIQRMKGLGALSNAEGEKLQNAVASLDLNMEQGAYLNQLKKIEAHYNRLQAYGALEGKYGRITPEMKAAIDSKYPM